VATPPAKGDVPRDATPSKNSTIPVGVPDPGATAVTVAVKVTDCPYTDGLRDEVTAVVVDAIFTT